jgi:hypothetical protein
MVVEQVILEGLGGYRKDVVKTAFCPVRGKTLGNFEQRHAMT